MKNRKLYESIQRLVNRKQCKKKNKQTFAEQYCNEQMKRKKLIPKNCTSKIDDLLKNFKRIKTFVDVDDLIGVVNQIYLQQEKQLKKQITIKNQQIKGIQLTERKKHNSEIDEVQVLNKAIQALKQYHHNMYMEENQNIGGVVQEFQKNSNYLCQMMNNKQKFGFIGACLKKIRRNKMAQNIVQKIKESTNGNEQNPTKQRQKQKDILKQKWNLYSKANNANYTKTQPNQNMTRTQSKYYQPIDKYMKKKKMFDLAQIYLQMILDQQYRKKWNKVKYQYKGKSANKDPEVEIKRNFFNLRASQSSSKAINININKQNYEPDSLINYKYHNLKDFNHDKKQNLPIPQVQQFQNICMRDREDSQYNQFGSQIAQSSTLNINTNTNSNSNANINSNINSNANIKTNSNIKTLKMIKQQKIVQNLQVMSRMPRKKEFTSSFSYSKNKQRIQQVKINGINSNRNSNVKIHKYKDIAIRKVNNFLLELEEDQNCLKNQKKLHLNHLDRLEKQIDQQNLFKSNKIWRDQEKCEQIMSALQRFQKRRV